MSAEGKAARHQCGMWQVGASDAQKARFAPVEVLSSYNEEQFRGKNERRSKSSKAECCLLREMILLLHFFSFFSQTVFMDLGTKIDFHHLKHLSKCPI